MTELTLSPLPHTWIFDIDGTICIHNGYKNGGDVLLDGVKDLFAKIPDDDMMRYCGNCGEIVGHEVLGPSGLNVTQFEFCQKCGRKVKWDET